MVDNDYWINRIEMIQNTALAKGSKLYNELKRQYEIAYKEIEKDIINWYNRFAKENNISFIEAKKLLTIGELEEFKWSLDEYIKKAIENETNELWTKQLKNASTRVHISRLDSLRIQIQNEMEKLYDMQIDGMTEIAQTIYEDNYYHTAYELQKGNNVAWKLDGIDNKAVNIVLATEWTDGNTFSDKIWNNKQKLISKLNTGLAQNFIRGSSPDELIKSISKEMNTDLNKAGRLVMTESAFFSAEAQKNCFNDLGVKKYRILGTLDSTTCSECGEYDSKEFDMADYKEGVTAPPFHPWCRCTTIPSFEDEFEFGERAARNMDGKTYYVPKNISYKEWKEKFVDNNLKEKAGFETQQKMMKNKYSDFEQYKRYKEILGKGKTFEYFQEMKYNNQDEFKLLKEYYRLNKGNNIPNDLTFRIYKNNLNNENWKAVGFNPQKLQKHFDKHSGDFKFNNAEEYEKFAKRFMNKEVKDNIKSFVNNDGYVFKYDTKKNIFATAKPNGITETCFKPKKGEEYWKEQVKKYGTEKEM